MSKLKRIPFSVSRSGIRVNDVINKINDIDASTLSLRDCQEIIQQCGRHLKIYVAGWERNSWKIPDLFLSLSFFVAVCREDDDASDDEMTADCWFKPLSDAERALLDWENRQKQNRRVSHVCASNNLTSFNFLLLFLAR